MNWIPHWGTARSTSEGQPRARHPCEHRPAEDHRDAEKGDGRDREADPHGALVLVDPLRHAASERHLFIPHASAAYSLGSAA
jgi:hypothetical protein